MAITRFTDAGFSPMFKRVFGEYGNNLYGTGKNDIVWSQITKKFTFKGSEMRFPVKVTFGGGVGFGALPIANASRMVNVELTRKAAYARMNLDRQTMIASKGREGAFREALQEEVEGKINSFMRAQACAFYNDGSGVLGQFSGNATGSAAAPVITALATGTYKFRQAFFEESDYIQVAQGGTVLLSSVWEITDVNTTTRVITLARISGGDDLTAIGAGTHSIALQGSFGSFASPTCPMGLKGVVEFASGSLYTVPFQRRFRSLGVNAQVASVNQAISIDFLNRAQTQTLNLAGEACNIIAPSFNQYEKLLNRLGDNVRYTKLTSEPNKMTSKALVSFDAVSMAMTGGEVKIVPTRYAEDDRVYGVNTDKITQYYAENFGWFDEDGNMLDRMKDLDAYEARFGGYYETFINPLYQWYIFNLSTT